MADLESFKAEILTLFKEETKDLWVKEDNDFLKQLAEDVAREKLLAVASPEAKEHADNLKFLAATMQSRVAAKGIVLNHKGKEVFERVLGMAIRTIAMAVFKV